MRSAFFTALALAVSVSPATSQTIRVQSGDHPTFTRLVLPVGEDREWEVTPITDTEWSVRVTPDIDGYDLTGAFDLIQRDRLAELSADETLTLSLACACGVESFRFEGRFLVIDISDPDPNVPRSPADEMATPEDQPDDATQPSLPDLASLLLQPDGLPPIALPDQPIDAVPAAETGGADPARTPNPRLAEAAELMAEQLARAAASGLLDASLGEPLIHADPSSPETPRAPVDPSVPADEPPSTPPPEIAAEEAETFPPGPLPIRAETALDPALRLDLPIGPPQADAACRGGRFAVRDWAPGEGFNHDLGHLRRDLFDERDRMVPEFVEQLAQHYLYYGFGAEAAHWLSQLPSPSEDLLHVAALIDGAPSVPFAPVTAPETCSQGELLWRYLGGAIEIDLDSETLSALQRAFEELPAGLRDHIGPRLARQLAEDRHPSAARNVRDIVQRGGRVDPSTLAQLDFDLGIATGVDDAMTRQALAEALRDDGGDAVAAMVHALAFDRSTGRRPEAARLVAAEALLRENAPGEATDDLWREVLLGRAALGQIDRSLEMLRDSARAGPPFRRALTDLIEERVAVGDTATLVILAHAHGADWRPDGSRAGRIQVQAIAALREAGLFEAAQILRDVRRPLILPAPDADPPTDETLTRAAWLGGDWDQLASAELGPHSEIAERMLALPSGERQPDTPSTSGPDLNALSSMVEDSRTLRTTVTDLMRQPALP